ncbi:Uncharacterised protein [Plesiomonas shigelloides]|nr:Uncharacterised protein [Plesiomonas shigelloides]
MRAKWFEMGIKFAQRMPISKCPCFNFLLSWNPMLTLQCIFRTQSMS